MIGIGMSRREREIVQILHRLGKATASEVHESMPEAPSYSAVRSILRILEEKGHIRHEEDGKRYVYLPAESSSDAARSALQQLMNTFFAGNPEGLVRTLLSEGETRVSDEDLNRFAALIEEARKREKTGEKS